MDLSELQVTLADLIATLNLHSTKFHLTGGLASSFYGEPRLTQDIDIVIQVPRDFDTAGLVETLADKFIVDPPTVFDAVRHNGLFQVLHQETMIKVDFHVGEDVPGELSRSNVVEIFRGVFAPILSIEDAILSKLIWIEKGSSKSRQDVKGMLIRGSQIDLEYLNNQARELGVQAILNELITELRS